MKPIQTNSPQEYLAIVISRWKNWEKHHQSLANAIREVLEQNEKLREENIELKRKLAYIHLYTQKESEVEK